MKEAGRRIRFLDMAKGVGILMVTFGHITELGNPVDQYMSLYKITVFYFISGYLMSYLNRYEKTGYSHHIDFNLMRFGDIPAVFFIGGICGSAGLLLVLEGLERVYVPAVLEYFGKNSLILMCAQRGLLILNIITEGWGKVFRLTDVVCKRFYIERLCILVILLVAVYGLTELIGSCKNRLFRKRGSDAA